MAARKAGVITVDFVAQSGKLQADTVQASRKLGQVGDAGRSSGRAIAAGMEVGGAGVRRLAVDADNSGRALVRYSAAALHGAEAVTALAASNLLAAGAMAKYTAGAASSVATTDQLVNSYRILRIVLSPTVFTAASLATGILVEETIRLVNARAKLIDQQALFATTHGVSFGAIDTLDATSRVAGGDAGNVRSLYTGLQSEWGSNQGGVQSALDKLGVSGNVGDPAILGRIAEGFRSIQDPVEKDRIAIALFGSQAGTALEELNITFAKSSAAVDKWGIQLDQLSRTQIHQFRQDLLELKSTLTDFSEVKAWWDSFETGTEIVAAAAEDMSKRGIAALDNMIRDWVPGFSTLRFGLSTLAPPLAHMFGQFGPAPIPETQPPPPVVPGAAQDTTGQKMLTQDIVAQMSGALQRSAESLEGQRALRDAKEAQSKSALAQAQNPKLTPEERQAKALEAQSAQAVAAAAGRYVQTMEDNQKAAEEAARAAEAALKSIESYERSIREHLMTPVERLFARRDDLGFSPDTGYGKRAAAAASEEASSLLNDEQAKIEKQNAALYFRPSKSMGPKDQIEFSGNMDAQNKQLDEIVKVWSESVIKALRNKAIPLQDVALAGRERAEQSALGANSEQKLRLQAAYDQQRVHTFQEEVQYQKELAALEADDLQIKLQAALQKEADAGKDVVLQARAALEVDKARLAIQLQQLQVAVQQSQMQAQNPFADGTLKSGIDQFFKDANAKAKQPGEILYDGLNHAVDGVSDELSKLMTGQKVDWGRMLQSLGQGMAKDATKSMIQQGLGAMGKKLGIPGLAPKKDIKPTGVFGDPVHVWLDNPSAAGGGQLLPGTILPPGIASTVLSAVAPGAGAAAGAAAGSLAGSSAATSVTSSISYGGPMAAGGPVSPDTAYWVGENGPEPFIPKSAGTIIPNHALRGGGDVHITQNFDARNADLGAGARVRQAAALHKQAVTDAVRVGQEHAMRTPHR